jgi:hypothetical protein
MEWNNIKDKKPCNNQIVLASINGVYTIARFDEPANCLVEITTDQITYVNGALSVYWTEFETPAT